MLMILLKKLLGLENKTRYYVPHKAANRDEFSCLSHIQAYI